MLGERKLRIWELAQKNLLLSNGMNFLAAFILMLLAPIFIGINNLQAQEAAKVLEQYISMIGIIMLTPVFRPELNKEIREVVEAKYTSPMVIYLIRIMQSLILILILILGFTYIMKTNSSKVILGDFVFGTFSTAIFLGSMGLLTYGISDQIILAYMIPVVYILLNLFTGSKYVKKFYLYSMMRGSMEEKYWLIGAAVLMTLFTIFIKELQRRLR